jgi:hypothetical protein
MSLEQRRTQLDERLQEMLASRLANSTHTDFQTM